MILFKIFLDIFIKNLLTNENEYDIFKILIEERKRGATEPCRVFWSKENGFFPIKSFKKEDTPMHIDEPIGFISCRHAGCEVARISCKAAASN